MNLSIDSPASSRLSSTNRTSTPSAPGEVLDRIDEIVPPGIDLDPADNYAATPPAIEHAKLRRLLSRA
jgi:hypothetical protein